MAGRGGARPGAGRKSKAEKYARPINAAEKQIVDKLPSIVDSLIRLAEGVFVEEYNPITDKVAVYQKAPDRAAAEYLIDRILGKPRQYQELAGAGGEPLIPVTEIVVQKTYDRPVED